MTTYRLVRWPRLSAELDQLKFRKALAALSVGRMTDRQLRDATRLRRTELALLLRALATAEALEIEPDAKASPAGPPRSEARCDIDLPMASGLTDWAALASLTFV